MGKEKPLEHDSEIKPSFSSHAADWLNTSKKHFTIAFQDAASTLPDVPDEAELHKATV